MGYVAASVRNSGCRDQREIQERSHDLAARLLMGTLFRGFDEKTSGPMDLRFKRSVGNAVRNLIEKQRNRRRLLPTVPFGQGVEPVSMVGGEDDDGERVIKDFRKLVHRRLGEIGAAVLDVRLAGGETKSLVGNPSLGSPGRYVVKRVVQQIKTLAKEYAASLGDSEMLRRIEKAMAGEEETPAHAPGLPLGMPLMAGKWAASQKTSRKRPRSTALAHLILVDAHMASGSPSRIPSLRRVQYGAANWFAQPRRTECAPPPFSEDIARF
jgi:hypothetical protein